MNTKQKTLAAAMVTGVAIFHYFIPRDLLTIHILFRFLYLVPITYVALYTGRLGGIVSAMAVTLIFLPHFFIPTTNHEFVAGNIGAIILFILAGYFVGNFRDKSEKEVLARKNRLQFVATHKGEGTNILFYADTTQLATAAAEWFMNTFGHTVTALTILSVYRSDESEQFSTEKEAEEYVSQRKKETDTHREHIENAFISKGIAAGKITNKSVTTEGKTAISDKILDELKTGSYDLVLLPKHDKTHAQEFLFGDTAVQLLRKASVPILSVKGSPGESTGQ